MAGFVPPAWHYRRVNALQLILGEEDFLIDRTINTIVAAVRDSMEEKPDDLPVTTLRAGEVTSAEIAELLSPSLFAEDRVVVLRDAHQAGKEPAQIIADTVQSPAPGIVLVVVHSGGGRAKSLVKTLRAAGAEVTECPKVTKFSEREDFVSNEFRRHNVRPTADTVHALLDAVGGDLRELSSAVSQLVSDTGGKVSPETVRKYYAGKADVTGFQVADKTLAGDTAGALGALRWALVGGLHPVPIADALGDSVLTLARIGSLGRVDPYNSARELGMPPWKIKKTQQQLRGWDARRLARAVQICTQLNGDVKGQSADAEYALEKAVRQVSELANG